MQVILIDKYVEVSYVESPKHMLYQHMKMSIALQDFKKMHLKALETIKQKSVTALIADTSKVTDTPFNECVEWLGKEFVPMLAGAGVKKLITIVPQTALGRIGKKAWQTKVLGIDMYDVKTKEEALALLK